MTVDEGFSQL